MTYRRVVNRNGLAGGYTHVAGESMLPNRAIAGDLRRLEADQRDQAHLEGYAVRTGLTEQQVKAVLDLFFDGDVPLNPDPLTVPEPSPTPSLSRVRRWFSGMRLWGRVK